MAKKHIVYGSSVLEKPPEIRNTNHPLFYSRYTTCIYLAILHEQFLSLTFVLFLESSFLFFLTRTFPFSDFTNSTLRESNTGPKIRNKCALSSLNFGLNYFYDSYEETMERGGFTNGKIVEYFCIDPKLDSHYLLMIYKSRRKTWLSAVTIEGKGCFRCFLYGTDEYTGV